jgi:hypothetical protein
MEVSALRFFSAMITFAAAPCTTFQSQFYVETELNIDLGLEYPIVSKLNSDADLEWEFDNTVRRGTRHCD